MTWTNTWKPALVRCRKLPRQAGGRPWLGSRPCRRCRSTCRQHRQCPVPARLECRAIYKVVRLHLEGELSHDGLARDALHLVVVLLLGCRVGEDLHRHCDGQRHQARENQEELSKRNFNLGFCRVIVIIKKNKGPGGNLFV